MNKLLPLLVLNLVVCGTNSEYVTSGKTGNITFSEYTKDANDNAYCTSSIKIDKSGNILEINQYSLESYGAN